MCLPLQITSQYLYFISWVNSFKNMSIVWSPNIYSLIIFFLTLSGDLQREDQPRQLLLSVLMIGLKWWKMEKRYVPCFFDYQKAFFTVPHQPLIAKLASCDVHHTIILLVEGLPHLQESSYNCWRRNIWSPSCTVWCASRIGSQSTVIPHLYQWSSRYCMQLYILCESLCGWCSVVPCNHFCSRLCYTTRDDHLYWALVSWKTISISAH